MLLWFEVRRFGTAFSGFVRGNTPLDKGLRAVLNQGYPPSEGGVGSSSRGCGLLSNGVGTVVNWVKGLV